MCWKDRAQVGVREEELTHLYKRDVRMNDDGKLDYRSDDLTAVWVPDESSEALRDLVRAAPEAATAGSVAARHRLSKFLLRSASVRRRV